MISIIYIDNEINAVLDEYLSDKMVISGEETIQYDSVEFSEEDDYISLLNNSLVKYANIIIIDSRLFENQAIGSEKFTGEEFKLILQKFYPYIETIIISQNDLDENIQVVKKYDSVNDDSAEKYYDKELKTKIEKSIERIHQTQFLAEKIGNNNHLDKLFVEKILGAVRGDVDFDNLKKEDIDRLIDAFKSVEGYINERL